MGNTAAEAQLLTDLCQGISIEAALSVESKLADSNTMNKCLAVGVVIGLADVKKCVNRRIMRARLIMPGLFMSLPVHADDYGDRFVFDHERPLLRVVNRTKGLRLR